MYLLKYFKLLPSPRPTCAAKALIFLQKWSILVQLRKGKKSILSGRKSGKMWRNSREVGRC
jgi:hypothetical protein